MIRQPHGGAVFVHSRDLHRLWGTERELLSCEYYTFKKISMMPNEMGGLQYHHKKDEAAHIDQGSAKVEYDSGNGKISTKWITPGDSVRFPQGAVHRMTAGDNGCTYYEVSTPYYNDRMHCEKSYGFEEETGGLPSTKLEDVIKVPPGAGLHD